MSTTVVTKVVSYQVGVDILGFPITEDHTKKHGKNMTKHHRTHTVVPRIFAYIVKQF